MRKHLYILAEGELDELLYERVCERVTRQEFERSTEFSLRLGSNWKTAMAGARLLMSRFKYWAQPQDVGVIIAVDNDRSPGHPGGKPAPRTLPKQDLRKPPRYSELVKIVEDALGKERISWPIDVALAVPVEMIESWLLTLLDPSCAESLPLFAEASQATARAYYQGNPPPQLKDLRKADQRQRGISEMEHFWLAAEQDLEAAAKASPSFAMFVKELQAWRKEEDQ